MLRTVLVDDEPPGREKLRRLLAPETDIDVVGEAGDGLTAVELIDRLQPDLVLLDIQMPELDGFEVLAALESEPWPYVIFVTAYDQYAVRAFEHGALDYLLKPVDPDRLGLALDRARTGIADGRRQDLARRVTEALDREAEARPPLDRFLVKHQGRSTFVAVGEVSWIEAAGNYLRLHTRNGYHLVRATLKQVESRLDPRRFARIHRTTMVNLDRVRHLEPWSHGDQVVILDSGERLTMSRRFRDRLPGTLSG